MCMQRYCTCEEDFAWNPSICACECNKNCKIGKCFKDCVCRKSLVDDLVITCNQIVDTPETTPIESVNKNGYYHPFTIYLAIICLMLLIFTAIAFYCHYIKQRSLI